MDRALLAALLIVLLVATLYYAFAYAPTCRASGQGHRLPEELDPLEELGRVGTDWIIGLIRSANNG